MKILVCTNHSYMFWQFRRELVQQLLQEHEVVLSTPFVGHEQDLEALGCRMVQTQLDRRGLDPVKDLRLLRFYRALLQKERPDLVVTYSIKPNIYAGLLCRRMKIPYYANVQGLGTAFQKPLLAFIATWLYRAALKDARTTFFENAGNADVFIRRRILKKQQQTLLPGAGVNLSYYALRPYPENETFHFLYLGRIMREKGMDELFWAARQLHAEGEKFVLDLVGFYEDAYRQEVDSLCALGIARFHGFQSEPRPWYEASDCVVMPSYHEGMSNVLLEAAAIGRPVITSRIHGCMEAVQEGATGLLAPAADRQALLSCMRQMLHTSRQDRTAMGLAAHRHMQQHFDKNKVVTQTLRVLVQQEQRQTAEIM